VKILHNRTTENHNVGPDIDIDGPYRIAGFAETVTDEQIAQMRSVVIAQINRTHSSRHAQNMYEACRSGREVAEVLLNPESYDAMLASVSLAIMACQNNAFAITRPPGHHASRERADGFCFFNNVAIAASYLLSMNKTVCIVDFDGHHGNGTQSIFQREDRVLFCSIHQSYTYPYTGLVSDVGEGPSFNRVINIPLSSGSGDDLFLKTLGFLREYIERFDPDYIGVSAGFDGYSKDRLLDLNYSMCGYHEAGRFLASLGKPLFAVLEGGYHDDVKECVDVFVSGVSGEKLDLDEQKSVSSQPCIDECLRILCTLSDTPEYCN